MCVYIYMLIYVYTHKYMHMWLLCICYLHISTPNFISISISIPTFMSRSWERDNEYMPGKIWCSHIPGKILFFSQLMSPSHNLMCSVQGIRDANINHTSFLPISGASPELEIILMLNILLIYLTIGNTKREKHVNDYKATWGLTRYLCTRHALPGQEEDWTEIKQVQFVGKEHIKWCGPYQK